MTGYLALDRDAVEALRRAVVRSLEELSGLRPADRAALDAVDSVDRAGTLLGEWGRRLAEISRCAALTDLVTFGTPGLPWSVVLPDATPITPGDVSLAAIVLTDRLRALGDAPSADALAAGLADALDDASPPVVAAALTALGLEWFTALLARLARGVDAAGRIDDPVALEDVDSAMATVRGLGPGFALVVGQDAGWERAWDGFDLALAAELLAGAGTRLGSDALARMAGTMLDRAAGGDPSPWWRHAVAITLDTVAADPVAARLTMLTVDDHTLDVAMFGADPVASGRFTRAAASSAFWTAADAAAPVSRLVEAIDRMVADADFVRFTDAPDARPEPAADWWLHPEGHPRTDPSMPVLVAEVIGPWLAHLITPIQVASWSPPAGAPTFEAADTDALSHTVTLLMTNAADAAVLRLKATQYLATSIDSPADQQHAAYLLAAIEDAGRSAGGRNEAGIADGIDALATTVGLLSAPFEVGPSIATTVLTTLFAETVLPDGRDLAAEAEASGFDVAAGVGLVAIGAWQVQHANQVPPLPPIAPPDRDVDPDDRADRSAGSVARQVREWAATIDDPDLRAEALALYDRMESAAAQGAGFTA